eukprot:7148527-Prymnesium_polylepis.1
MPTHAITADTAPAARSPLLQRTRAARRVKTGEGGHTVAFCCANCQHAATIDHHPCRHDLHVRPAT